MDPIKRFNRWLNDASKAGIELAEAVALATADSGGRPSVRYVLLKSADGDGFVFYTNTQSIKAQQLHANPYAALAVYWHETDRQVRVEGSIETVTEEEADQYWSERPFESQAAAMASEQSRTLASRSELTARYKRICKDYADIDIPRPRHWSGYRLVPAQIEFWTRKEPRLHERELFVRSGKAWKKNLLQP